MTHEDERRILTSIPYKDGEIKVIATKQDCALGNHYHKIKTEEFKLIKGHGTITINKKTFEFSAGTVITIDPYDEHSFEIKKDSILFCICSHPYDKNDDYEK